MIRSLVPLAALAVAGCATSSLTLLPDEGGGSGAVAVLESGGRAQETLVDQANSRTAIGGARPRTRAIDPDRLTEDQRAALDNLPPPPRSFTLYFDEGKTSVAAGSEGVLADMFAEVARREGVEVQVTGHTDTIGRPDDNDRLSINRAREIRDALVARGLNASITSVVGRGERELLVPTADDVREARNRRVEVTVR